MKKLKDLGPVLFVVAFPILLLTIQSAAVVRSLWFGAMMGLSLKAGESLERLLSRNAAWGLAIAGTIAAAILFSLLNYGPAGTPLDLGNFALLAVAIGMPVSALRIKYRKT
jgi:hypothetical protein